MVKYPKEWTLTHIGDFVSISRGASPRPIETYLTSNPDGINWIKIGDAPKYGKYISHTEEKITQKGAKHSVYVKSGDFLLSNSMSFGRPYILATDGCIHDGWLRLYEYQSSAYKDYLYYILSSDYVKTQYVALAAGSGVQNLNKEVVKQVFIPLPPLPEQKAIADTIATFDTHIENLTELIEKKKAVRDGALEDLVSGRVRLKGFSGVWNSELISEIGTFIKGAPLSKSDISSSGTPFILYGELYTTYKEVTYQVYRKTLKKVDKDCYSRIGDVIIPTSGETAEEIATATCVMVPNVILAGDLNIFRPTSVEGRFFSYIINHMVNNQISKLAQGISIIHINSKSIGSIKIQFPSIEEQTAIADTLTAMDNEIKALEDEHDKMIQIREGAMDDLLTGRIRLKKE